MVRFSPACLLAGLSAAAAAAPADLPRMSICLNGAWEVAWYAPADSIPKSDWIVKRTPAVPIVTNPPTESAWYRMKLKVPREWAKPGRVFLLRLEKVGHYAGVYWNGAKVSEHYGQFTAFETDISRAIRPGEENTVAIFVHNATGKFVRAGANLTDPMEGNAYRGATDQVVQRNWMGIVGDVSLCWRPATRIADVRTQPSVRRHRLEARVTTDGTTAGMTVHAAVLDGDRVALQLPEQPVGDSFVTLAADWRDPVLWGPEPYGKPKLYVLRTELRRGGKVVDRQFTRFGFREVWVEGKDVLLNGKKLWMAGTYFGKLASIRYINDRRPQSRVLAEMQASGLNTLHGHWDELGDHWLDRCDEAGMVVLGGFYCDGRPQIQSKADAGWADWMTETCRDWVRAMRNHPSIVMWRPTDVLPANVSSRRPEIWARFAEQVRREDGTRPLADDTDIQAWSQSPLKNPQPGAGPRQLNADDYDDGSRMASALAEAKKPLLTKEIYAGFGDVENLSRFFRLFYEKSFAGNGTGIVVQHLPLEKSPRWFLISWPSQSGEGNRDSTIPTLTLPNWCDPSQPEWTPGPYSKLFAELSEKVAHRAPLVANGDTSGEVLVSGMAADDIVFLVPANADAADPVATRAAADGTAWSVAPAGSWQLYYAGGSKAVSIATHATERVNVGKEK